MEDNAENSTYERLEGRPNLETSESPEMDSGPPKDRRNVVLIGLMVAGIGFVLPYNR